MRTPKRFVLHSNGGLTDTTPMQVETNLVEGITPALVRARVAIHVVIGAAALTAFTVSGEVRLHR